MSTMLNMCSVGTSLHLIGVYQGSPTPGPQTSRGPWPVRNQATQKEVSGGRASKASSATPHLSPSLASPPEPLPALPREPSPSHCLWKNCLPRKCSLVPKRLGAAGLYPGCTTVVLLFIVWMDTFFFLEIKNVLGNLVSVSFYWKLHHWPKEVNSSFHILVYIINMPKVAFKKLILAF